MYVRTLDSDIQLNKRQRESAMSFAEEIYNATSEEDLNAAKRRIEDLFNSTAAQQTLGINFKINVGWDIPTYINLEVDTESLLCSRTIE